MCVQRFHSVRIAQRKGGFLQFDFTSKLIEYIQLLRVIWVKSQLDLTSSLKSSHLKVDCSLETIAHVQLKLN